MTVAIEIGQNANGLGTSLDLEELLATRLLVQGKPNKLICRDLKLSEGTVKAHLSAAFRTLGVQNRTEAVFAAARFNRARFIFHFPFEVR